MISALLIGRAGSRGVPGKNTALVLGRPLMMYPILAARHTAEIGQFFLSTDGDAIESIGRQQGFEIIDRPPPLASDAALVEDVVVHGFREIERRTGPQEMVVLLFCNSATIQPGILAEGIARLRSHPEADSAVTVSLYNEYSPVRAMRIDEEGLIRSYIDISAIRGASCDRDSADPCYFIDCSAWVLRPRCLRISEGILPFRWIGRTVLPLHQRGGLDVDQPFGLGHTEYWLREHGFSVDATPYDTVKAQCGDISREP